MKKLFAMIFVLVSAGLYYTASAQCTPPAPTGNTGLTPNWGCLPCVERNTNYAEVITIENFSTVGGITIDSLRLDSLTNTPPGLGYTVSPSNATFPGGGTGCIDVTGSTSDTVGSYKLGIYVTVWIAGLGNFGGEAGEIIDNLIQLGIIDTSTTPAPNFDYFIRVTEAGGSCTIDDSCSVGIKDLSQMFTSLTAQPNPFSSRTEVSWTSNTDGKFTAKVFDMAGKTVFSKELHVRIGSNKVAIERGELPAGSYLFILTDGSRDMSTKLMVRE